MIDKKNLMMFKLFPHLVVFHIVLLVYSLCLRLCLLRANMSFIFGASLNLCKNYF